MELGSILGRTPQSCGARRSSETEGGISMHSDLLLIQQTVDHQLRIGNFITAAETVDKNVPRGPTRSLRNPDREDLMSMVLIEAFKVQNKEAMREIFNRFAGDLSTVALEALKSDNDFVGELTATDEVPRSDFDDEPTKEMVIRGTIRNN